MTDASGGRSNWSTGGLLVSLEVYFILKHLSDFVSVHSELEQALDICIQNVYFTCSYLSLQEFSY